MEERIVPEDAKTDLEHHESEHSHHHHHEGEDMLDVDIHDDAVVGTVKRVISKPYDMVVENMRSQVKKIAGQIEEKGGFVGHIKGIIKGPGTMCRLSIVEGDADVDTEIIDKTSESEIDFVFIVFGMEADEVKEILKNALFMMI